MSKIDDDFVRDLARMWHGLELSDAEAAGIRAILTAQEPIAESAAKKMSFDAEPAGFIGFLETDDKS